MRVEVHFKSRTPSQGILRPNAFSLIAIGELARRTGVASSALRYYERVGLLSPAARAGGRRHYGAASAERVALIQLCQDAGFTLREIRALLAAGSRQGRAWARLAEAKLRELETRIAQAERARMLVQHALACRHRTLIACPNFRAAVKAYLDPRQRPGHAADDKAVPQVMRRRGNSTGRVTET
jgi:DNA-binding transcriptional MerR regulator